MENLELRLKTDSALAVVGLDRKAWDNLMHRQHYTAAPPLVNGHTRYFSRDDMVCLFVLDHWIRLGVEVPIAARVASAIRTELRKGGEGLQALWIVSTESGMPRRVTSKEPHTDMMMHKVNVAAIRANIQRIAAEKFGT